LILSLICLNTLIKKVFKTCIPAMWHSLLQTYRLHVVILYTVPCNNFAMSHSTRAFPLLLGHLMPLNMSVSPAFPTHQAWSWHQLLKLLFNSKVTWWPSLHHSRCFLIERCIFFQENHILRCIPYLAFWIRL
jgi:hypothetical protein